MESLDELDISWNKELTTLPRSLCRLPALKKLNAGFCGLTKLPDDWECMSLEELDISGNKKLTILPSSICQLQALKKLVAGSCGLKKLPDCWDGMKSLEELDLSCNKDLTTLTPSMCKLQALKNLCAKDCSLIELPDAWEDMKSLEVLDISNNHLEAYPKVTLHWTNLITLDLSNDSLFTVDIINNYQSASHNATMGSESHPTPDLSNDLLITEGKGYRNMISELPEEVVSTSLIKLYLKHNPMVVPPSEVCDQGMEAIRKYFRDGVQGKESLCTDTINMLGNTGAGKTSIAQSLLMGRLSACEVEDRTRVIDQNLLKIGDGFVIVNDFGGHEIYHKVVPIFLPNNGLCIIAYSIVEDIEEQKNQVKKWLMTVFARSTDIRVIIVGTHSDLLEADLVKTRLNDMESYASELQNSAVGEFNSHISVLGNEDCNQASINLLKQSLATLSSADVSFRSLSCKKNVTEQPEDGLPKLFSLIKDKLKTTVQYPASWYNIMKEIKEHRSSEDRPYLEWQQVKDVYGRHLNQEPDDSTLKVILRSLLAASQIIWLESSQSLKHLIFHQPQHIVADLKKILHHDNCERMLNDLGEDYYRTAREEYARGFLDENFFALLLGKRDRVPVVASFMQYFLLINLVNKGKYILTSNLTDEPPPKLEKWLQELSHNPTVRVRLTFIGNIRPLAFFTTNLASVIKWACSKEATPECWKDGVLFVLDCIRIVINRINGTLDVIAFSKSTRENIWNVVQPLLSCIGNNIAEHWKGVPPKCRIICPRHTNRKQPDGRDVLLDELAKEEAAHAIPNCKATWHCIECEDDIPGLWMYPYKPGPCSDEEIKIANEYLKRLGTRSSLSAPAVKRNLEVAIRENSKLFTDRLTKEQTVNIATYMYGKSTLTGSELEAIKQNQLTATEAASKLVIDFVLKKGGKIAETFLSALHQDNVGADELAALIDVGLQKN